MADIIYCGPAVGSGFIQMCLSCSIIRQINHPLPPHPACWIKSATKYCQALALQNNIKVEKGGFTQEEEKLTQKNSSSGAVCFLYLQTDQSVVLSLKEWVYKNVVHCIIKHQGQSHSSRLFLNWRYPALSSPPTPSWCAVWSGRMAAIFWSQPIQQLWWKSHLNSNGG